MNIPTDDRPYGWIDFQPEPEMTGDGAGDPDKHYLTIGLWEGGAFSDEVAVIVHRTVGGKYPIDGALVQEKRLIAQHIVKVLNDNPIDFNAILDGIDFQAANEAHLRATPAVAPPEFTLEQDEDGHWHTRCPHCSALDTINEHDSAIRWNRLNLEQYPDRVTASLGDGGDWDASDQPWICDGCLSRDISAPEGFTIDDWY